MPNMPTHFVLWLDRLDLLIDSAISLVDTIVPHCLPRQDLGIAEDGPPQRDIVSIRRPLPTAAGRHPLLQRVISLESALYIDASRLRFFLAEGAETSHSRRIVPVPVV